MVICHVRISICTQEFCMILWLPSTVDSTNYLTQNLLEFWTVMMDGWMDAQRTLSIGPWIIIVLYYLCYLGQCIDGPALFRRMSKLLGSNHVAFSSLGFPVSTGIISHSWSHWAACTVIQENRGNVWNSQNQRRSRAVCGIVIGTGVRPVRPPMRDWGAFQLVGSFPGCHHHRPRPYICDQPQTAQFFSETILMPSCVLVVKLMQLARPVKQIESAEKEFPSSTSLQSWHYSTKTFYCTAARDITSSAVLVPVQAQYKVLQCSKVWIAMWLNVNAEPTAM